ncbi:MAG: ADP-ribosylglycohydrolase family protein [Gemmataceae bacterium]
MSRRWLLGSAIVLIAAALGFGVVAGGPGAADGPVRRLPLKVFRDKMEGAWVGQMAGVGWGIPIEFAVTGKIVPEGNIPKWHPNTVNQFDSISDDDLWVEMTFLRTLEKYGLDVTARQAGIDLANTRYPAWVSDEHGRNNLRNGIAPPDSGHPKFNPWADDICYQIQADFTGIISPGMPQGAIDLGETFGRLTAYGDGLYGGQFVGGMYCEAFFETDPVKVIEAGLRCIPRESYYHEIITDTLRWWRENPDDWQKTWHLLEARWNKDLTRRRADPDRARSRNILATLNGAYIVMGLLYGKGDPDATMRISMRCGQDNDCNPSNAGGVLFTMMGLSKVPDTWKSALDRTRKFMDSPYNFNDVSAVCEALARQMVVRRGGRIERGPDGDEVFVIPQHAPKPGPLERAWEPGPIANSRYTAEERARIRPGKQIEQKPQQQREEELRRQRRSPFDPRGEIHIPIGVPNTLDTLKTFVEPEGCFSPGVGSYGIYCWTVDPTTGTVAAPTFDGVKPRYGLTPEGYLVPWTEWGSDGMTVRNELCQVRQPSPQGEVVVVGSRVRVTNRQPSSRKASLVVALRPMGPAGFPVRRLAVAPGGDALMAEDRPALVARQKPTATGVLVSDTIGEAIQQGHWPVAQSAAAAQGTCSGAMRFDLTLAAGETKTFEFVCPVLPGRRAARHQWDNNSWFKIDQAEFNPARGGVLQPDPGVDFFRRIDVRRLFEQAQGEWRDLLGSARLTLPDARWEQSRQAIMGHLAMVLNEGAPDLVVVNLSVFNRDAAYMANSLQKAGLFGLAEIYIDHFLKHPFQGRVQPEADNPGQILWTLGEHWKLTRNRDWLARVYPAVEKLTALIRYYRTTPGPHWVCDDSYEFGDALPKDRRKLLKPGACDGHNPAYTEAFDIAGLHAAVALARELGKADAAAQWQRLADDLFARYDRAFGGDLAKGYGSYAVQWPCRLYPLTDGKGHARFKGIGAKQTGEWRYFPLATAHQGLYSGNRAAGHGTIDSHLAEPQMVGWYTFDEGGPSGMGGWPRLHTTWSWNYPGVKPQSARTAARAMPDGWALAEFWLLMRDSLLFEDGDRLVLLGGVSPEWFKKDMAVSSLPTWFGPCGFRYRPTTDGAVLTVDGKALPPGGFVLRLPAGLKATVRVNGKPIAPAPNGDFPFPAGTREVTLVLN